MRKFLCVKLNRQYCFHMVPLKLYSKQSNHILLIVNLFINNIQFLSLYFQVSILKDIKSNHLNIEKCRK